MGRKERRMNRGKRRMGRWKLRSWRMTEKRSINRSNTEEEL